MFFSSHHLFDRPHCPRFRATSTGQYESHLFWCSFLLKQQPMLSCFSVQFELSAYRRDSKGLHFHCFQIALTNHLQPPRDFRFGARKNLSHARVMTKLKPSSFCPENLCSKKLLSSCRFFMRMPSVSME